MHIATPLSVQIAEWQCAWIYATKLQSPGSLPPFRRCHLAEDSGVAMCIELCNKTAIPGFSAAFQALPPRHKSMHSQSAICA